MRAVHGSQSCGLLLQNSRRLITSSARTFLERKPTACERFGGGCRPSGLRLRDRPVRIDKVVRSMDSAAAPVGEPSSPEGGGLEAEKFFRVAKVCVGVCLAVGLCASLGTSGGQFASVAAAGMSQKGLGVAVQGAWAGLSAGCLHTLAGPDHLAGLAPLTLGQNRYAAAGLGALWGFGHSSGQLILGIAFILLKERFQGLVPILSKWAGTIVGLTLITIGVLGIYESFCEHSDHDEIQVSGSGDATLSARRKGWGTYMMGFVYGLQPDALFIVLPALALPTRFAAFSYISMFVIGTVLAMGGYTLMIGTASEAAKEKPWLSRNLSTIAGTVAVVVGLTVLLGGFGFELPLSV
ncbi:hypothetical protein BSKO_13125 [Bryopsis sp. KO-2023]|nr:hypothetical protein BSKO_13125 [Bryopsis sp. KO-2023]